MHAAGVTEVGINCPFCWEPVTILVDTSVEFQQYVEDCEVCCRPMELTIDATDGVPSVTVEQGN